MADFIEYVWLSSINNWKIGFGGNAGFFSVIYINSIQLHLFRRKNILFRILYTIAKGVL